MPQELADIYANSEEVTMNMTLRACVTGRLVVQLVSGGRKPAVTLEPALQQPLLTKAFLETGFPTWCVLDTHAGDQEEWIKVWTMVLKNLGTTGCVFAGNMDVVLLLARCSLAVHYCSLMIFVVNLGGNVFACSRELAGPELRPVAVRCCHLSSLCEFAKRCGECVPHAPCPRCVSQDPCQP